MITDIEVMVTCLFILTILNAILVALLDSKIKDLENKIDKEKRERLIKHIDDFWPIGTMIFNGDEDWYRGRKSSD